MAKKKTTEKTNEGLVEETKLEVTNCDIKTIDNINIESLIHIIRGLQVMLDSDLAMLYGVETKRLNEQVKRNIDRFPADFMFQLTQDEAIRSRSQNATLNTKRGQNIKYLPYAFTRNGVAMLSSVLKTDIAVGVNIRIMRAFTMLPQLVNHNTQIIQRIFNIEQHQQETDNTVKMILDKIEDISPKSLPEQIFPTGCVWDAWAYISDLVRNAKQRIILIDNFVDDRVLSMFTKRANGVSATIHSRYNEQFLTDLKKHNTQYPEIEFIQLPHRNHDRFLIIDEKVYFIGASLKDIGTGLCAVAEMEIAPETILGLVK
ncbi:MAG: ORF6N domain-containing protein [Bacteroidales bacterium]|nr:ORF6N domain-containing protein [Bacteroidales bacterium]